MDTHNVDDPLPNTAYTAILTITCMYPHLATLLDYIRTIFFCLVCSSLEKEMPNLACGRAQSPCVRVRFIASGWAWLLGGHCSSRNAWLRSRALTAASITQHRYEKRTQRWCAVCNSHTHRETVQFKFSKKKDGY